LDSKSLSELTRFWTKSPWPWATHARIPFFGCLLARFFSAALVSERKTRSAMMLKKL
jgi:hypothetical protein